MIPAKENDANVAVIHVAHDLSEERGIRTQLITSDRLASIGRLAAGVAHEINNPAAFVTVNLGVLRDRFVAGTARSQDVLAMLDDSLNGMERIRDIVRDLKGLARDRSVDLVDLAAVAQSAVRMTAHETRGRARVERIAEEGTFRSGARRADHAGRAEPRAQRRPGAPGRTKREPNRPADPARRGSRPPRGRRQRAGDRGVHRAAHLRALLHYP